MAVEHYHHTPQATPPPGATSGIAGAPSPEWYHIAFDAVPLPVIVYDRDSLAVVAVNDPAVERYGFSREEFLQLSILHMRPPEDQAAFVAATASHPAGVRRTAGVRHMRKDGAVMDVDVWARDLDVPGRRLRIAATADVGDRLELQAELRHAQKMEAVGRLAGGVAHDFNNSLTAIMGLGDLLLERVANDAEAEAEVRGIRQAADRAAALTQRLLAFGRRQVLRAEVTNLNDVLTPMVPLLRASLGEDVEVALDAALDLWLVRVDADQLAEVVTHLAMNARDAMPDGGALQFVTRNLPVEATVRRGGLSVPAGEYIELAVTDTGQGMDELTRANAFEPFFTTKGPDRGTGLGLPMVYGVVRQSGGFVDIESAAGAGTTFRVLLPRAGRASGAATRVAAPAPGATTVLVVEDEDAVRRITCRVLERLGYHVLEAASGEEAVPLVEAHCDRLTLLVTDVIMPRMGGRALAERAMARCPGLRILYVSGYTDEAFDQGDLLRDGVGFLQKPFSVESLGDAVRKVLGHAESA